MMPDKDSSIPFYEIVDESSGHLRLCFFGRLDHRSAADILRSLNKDLKKVTATQAVADLSRVAYFDDFGALILFELKSHLAEQQCQLEISAPPERARDLFRAINFNDPQLCDPITVPKRENLFVRLGDATIAVAYNVRFMVSFLGSVALCLVHILRHPKSLRISDTITLMQKIGVDAVPIIGLISFLLGLIMAFVSSLQLAQFGASIYVASLVALAMVSELGPIMTAIVVAGRSGSAFAAEIGTMRISEEIDALFTMGFSPTLFLTIPRILAAMVVVPLLTLFSDLFAILGGLVISVTMLDLTASTYIAQTLKALSLFEFAWGMFKSIIFAALIAGIGCLRGFQVRGGSSEVGNAATSAVVSGIFLIILFDSIFAVIRSYW